MRKKICFLALLIVVLGLWFFYPFIISSDFFANLLTKDDWTTRGVFGDSFGALNTLFSGLALVGLAYNIYLQSIQLKKLEKQEQENSKRIDAQVEAQSLTAILNYYNSEIDRYTSILFKTHTNIYSKIYEDLKLKQTKLMNERESILAQLRSKTSLS